MKFTNIGCLTIVSKNYISTARVLCDTFLEHHPGAKFFVVLVDKLNDEFDPEKEKFELLSLYEIGIPSPDIFPYQYTILELNTAVKPFALKHLLLNEKIDKLTYIDPDIIIANPLKKVWDGLDDHIVVLTPHMREPFNDNDNPSEVGILQSGTYNLGFIGLANSKESLKLLDWWLGKLYLDCVVDIPNGLFVDQKWMDLVPAYFEKTLILHDPSYNAAYWNLHERDVSKVNNKFYVNDIPLSFFHFSGYDPRKPDILSKHQSRHQLEDETHLKDLFDLYGEKLFEANLQESKEYVYAYGTLPNGVEVPRAMFNIVRHCLKNHIVFPSPEYDTDAFCTFLMTPNITLFGYSLAPLFHGILMIRPDVKEHFPNAWYGDITGFVDWVYSNGKEEENLSTILEQFGNCLNIDNPVKLAYEIYEKRNDVANAFQNLAFNDVSFNRFIDWMTINGVLEETYIDQHMITRTISSKNGFFKSLVLYFMRSDLQVAFPNIHKQPKNYFNWLKENLHQLPYLTEDEIFTFLYMARNSGQELDIMQINYNQALRQKSGYPLTHFNSTLFMQEAKKYFSFDKTRVMSNLLDNSTDPLRELELYYSNNEELEQKYPKAFSNSNELLRLGKYVTRLTNISFLYKNSQWIKKLKKQIEQYEPNQAGINIAGYFDASTGMGQSARSMLSTIKASELEYTVRTLPNLFIDENKNYLSKEMVKYFGHASTVNRINLLVSNADSIEDSFNFYPVADMYDRRNIGYWVWETEELPKKFTKSAEKLDEIWTPSEYSANAIRKNVDIPVHVLSHIIDFNEIDSILSQDIDRDKFNLPVDALLFGYFFDQKSNLERKNPESVIKAFKKAFKNDWNVYLLLKVNTPKSGELEYEMLKATYQDLNIIWLEETLSRDETLQLMHCLDVYISLHRSEGFGLTIAEAMALGKPVVASNYSGNVDFMNSDCAYMIDTPTIMTKQAYGPYPRGTIWGDPDTEMASKAMLDLKNIENRIDLGKKARMYVKSVLSPDTISEKLINLVNR